MWEPNEDIRFEKILSSLKKARDPEKLLKLLNIIRKYYSSEKEHFQKLRENKGLKVIEHAIIYQNHKTLINIALSILGNCCLIYKEYAYDLCHKAGFFNSLENILKKYPNDKEIFCRASRIIGNICRTNSELLLGAVIIRRYPDVIKCFVNYCNGFIEEAVVDSTNFNSISMILRCFRNFIYSSKYSTIRNLLKDLYVFKAIAGIFNKFCTNWRESEFHKNLINIIINTVHEYVKFDPICSLDELSEEDFLNYLPEAMELAPRKVIAIVINLQKRVKLKSDLPIVAICDKFNELLVNSAINKVSEECGEYLICYALLLDHPANISDESGGKCIQNVIKILSDLKEPTSDNLKWSITILSILIKFQYNHKLLSAQFKYNIIEIISEKLKWLVGDVKNIKEKHPLQRKRKSQKNHSVSPFQLSPPSTEDENCNESSQKSPPVIDLTRRPWLEGSDEEMDLPRSSGSLSPCSSSSSDFLTNPSSSSTEQQDLSDSDDYSPVCSDNEDASTNTEQIDDEPALDDLSELKPRVIKQIESAVLDPKNLHLKFKFLHKVSDLLKIYCRFKPIQLFSIQLLKRLLQCSLIIEFSQLNLVDNLISPILYIHEHFMYLLHHDFIVEVFNLTQSQHGLCSRCGEIAKIGKNILNTLYTVARMGSIEGQIEQVFLKESISDKRNCISYIPYIVRSSFLTKIMLNYRGLEILVDILKLDDCDYRKSGIQTICYVASNILKIANPKDTTVRPKLTILKYEDPPKEISTTVTFQLDDGSILKADRLHLMDNSEFFSKLLTGYFKESKQSVVNIRDAKLKAFSCILQLSKEISLNSQYNFFDLDFAFYMEIDDLLEAIGLCDRYLMCDMCIYLMTYVEKNRMCPETVPNIYKWSIESCTDLLRVESVAYALVEKVNHRTFDMFNKLLKLGLTDELTVDIRNLLVRYFE